MAAARWLQAIACLEAITGSDAVPDAFSAPALLQLSSACLRLDRYRDARAHALRAAALRPVDAAILQAIVNALSLFNEPEVIAALLDDCAPRIDVPSVLVDLARVASSFGLHERALVLLDRSDAIDKGSAQSLSMRGLVHMFQGRSLAAEADFKQCLEARPDFAHVHWFLSQVSSAGTKPEHARQVARILEHGAADDVAEAYLAYALHNELHDLQRYDEAFVALERGCRAKKRLLPYDAALADRLFSELKALCTAEFVRTAAAPEPGGFTPIFIVGMHRSGTSLLERILGGHSQVTDGGESYDFIAQVRRSTDHFVAGALDVAGIRRLSTVDFGELGHHYLDGARWRAHGRAFLTEKLPTNFLHAGFIAKALPQARILHLTRNAADTCFSNLRTHFSGAAPYSYDQVEVADYYARYSALMQHWQQVMPARLLEVSYDQLVHSPEATVRGIFEFCGLPFEAATLQVGRRTGSVATASSMLVRDGIRTDRGAAWKHYEKHLQPMLGQLRKRALL